MRTAATGKRLVAAGLLAWGLVGCATAPAPPPLHAKLPSQYDATPAESPLPVVALDTWWRLFRDPQLEALERQALSRAPDAQAAVGRLKEATATLATALTPFDPQGAISATGATQNTQLAGGNIDLTGIPLKVPLVALGQTGTAGADFNVSWEIDLFGRRHAADRVARADLAAARFAFEGARASLAAAVADALFTARGVAEQVESARDALKQDETLAALVRMQVETGLVPAADLSRTEVEIAKAKAQLVGLEAELIAQRRSLLVLIGDGTAPLSALPITPLSSDSGGPTFPAATPGDLLQRRPDVREADARLRSAFGSILVDKLELFPHFSILPGVGVSEVSRPGNAYTTSLWSVGLGLAVPVLDRHRLLAVVRAQDARALQAAADYEKAVQTAYGEASNVLTRLDADTRQVALLAKAASQAKAMLDYAETGYAAGVQDWRSVLETHQAWSSAAAALAQARTQALRRSVQAFKALGGGWSEDDARPAMAERRSGARPG